MFDFFTVFGRNQKFQVVSDAGQGNRTNSTDFDLFYFHLIISSQSKVPGFLLPHLPKNLKRNIAHFCECSRIL